MNFKSITQLVKDIKAWSYRMDFDYACILGVPDSGLLVGHILSGMTGKPMVSDTNYDNVLVVDDTLLTSKTLSPWKSQYPKAKFGAVYVKPGREGKVDTYYKAVAPPRLFEWNMWKSKHLEGSMVDIDGVLCRELRKSEIDYGERMLSFYQTVRPRVIPGRRIGTIVTGRLETYRDVTEEWLARYNINYNRLVMRDVRSTDHSEFKSSLYAESNARLFIESSERQARVISAITGKSVLCSSTMELL